MWGRWGRNHSARRYCGNMTARSYWPNRSACSATARQLSAASVHLPGVPTSGGIAGVFGAWKSEQSLISLVIRLACLTAVRIKVPQARWAASPFITMRFGAAELRFRPRRAASDPDQPFARSRSNAAASMALYLGFPSMPLIFFSTVALSCRSVTMTIYSARVARKPSPRSELSCL
jgi:hypothetical protein